MKLLRQKICSILEQREFDSRRKKKRFDRGIENPSHEGIVNHYTPADDIAGFKKFNQSILENLQ